MNVKKCQAFGWFFTGKGFEMATVQITLELLPERYALEKEKKCKEKRENVMIREMKEADANQVARIWLDSNREAHDFIPAEYWEENYQAVKEALLQGEVYVCEMEMAGKTDIVGFIGLNEDFIEGIFVRDNVRSRGVGRELLDYVKDRRNQLMLGVYQKNLRAIRFYQREEFFVRQEGVDGNTGEKEYTMLWRRQ
jgi:putative acetyltransferase